MYKNQSECARLQGIWKNPKKFLSNDINSKNDLDVNIFTKYFSMTMAYLGHIMNSKSLYYHFPMLKM